MKTVSNQIQREAGQVESPALFRLVEWLEGPQEGRPFSADDLGPLADLLVDTALTSPWPARYAWALGKIPQLASEKTDALLRRLPADRIDEELLWQATVALQNAATPPEDETRRLVTSLYRRIVARAATTPIASLRREQLHALLLE